MEADIKIVEEAKKQAGMNPRKFALWIFMVSVIMIFGAFTSAYIVRQAEGNWLDFELPSMFWMTTVIIAMSSVTMHVAYLAVKRGNMERAKVAMSITFVFGIAFLIGQLMGWNQLVDNGIYFVGRDASGVSGSFIYVISGLHGLHVVSGVIALAAALLALFDVNLGVIKFKQPKTLEMCASYWHFLGGLWLYLFVFLLLNR